MKCVILHESPGRLRLHAAASRMTLTQADAWEAYLKALPGVRDAAVYDRTGDLVITYRGSREEILKAVAAFFGKDCLRGVDETAFYAALPALRETCGDRAVLRAVHFFAENERVRVQRERIRAGDTEGFLALVRESGDSSYKYLQNIYTVKNVGEQGLSLALALCGRLGAVCRVHGGGFAGTVQAYVEKSEAETFRRTLSAVFGENACLFLSFRPFGAVRVEQTRILEGETAFDVTTA